MQTVTITLPNEIKSEMQKFAWVNWSVIALKNLRMKMIFEEYMKTKKISKENQRFCEAIDWHPVDELPLKKSHIKEIQKALKGKFIRYDSVDELFKK